MDGSEEGNVLPAAILSGAPVDLQARTVRYDNGYSFLLTGLTGLETPIMAYLILTLFLSVKHLQTDQACNAEWPVGWLEVEDGLGCAGQGPPMGEPPNWVAIFWGFRARDAHQFQEQGRRRRLRREAGIRIFRPGTQRAENSSQGVREQFPVFF